MQFSLIALIALPLLAAAGPMEKRDIRVFAQKPNFYHGTNVRIPLVHSTLNPACHHHHHNLHSFFLQAND